MKSLVELGYHRPRFWGYYEDAASVQLSNIVYDGSACLCFFPCTIGVCVCVCFYYSQKHYIREKRRQYSGTSKDTESLYKMACKQHKMPSSFCIQNMKMYVHEPCVLPVILYLHESCSVILHLLAKLHFFLNLKVALTFSFCFMSHCILGPGLFALRGQ